MNNDRNPWPLWAAIALMCMGTGCAYLDKIPLPEPAPAPLPEPIPEPPPTPEPAPPEPATGYTITHVSRHDITWTGPDLPWSSTPQPGACGDCVAEAHLYLSDGRGGKFDWMRRDTKWRDFNNIHNGYRVWGTLKPTPGDTVRLEAVHPTGRVVIGEFQWQ